jgi:hypothetical protein
MKRMTDKYELLKIWVPELMIALYCTVFVCVNALLITYDCIQVWLLECSICKLAELNTRRCLGNTTAVLHHTTVDFY